LTSWKLLRASTGLRLAAGDPFAGAHAASPSVGQLLLAPKQALVARVLADPRVHIYACGRRDIRTGVIDRRVLATLELLAATGLHPTVGALRCAQGASAATSGPAHAAGAAVDIVAVNSIAIRGHQGARSITARTIKRVLALQGALAPAVIVSDTKVAGAVNVRVSRDHTGAIHIGFSSPATPATGLAGQLDALFAPREWSKLVGRLDTIANPEVRAAPSRAAIDLRSARAARG
jgi:hypothetical protein